jgi:hypothetical protein
MPAAGTSVRNSAAPAQALPAVADQRPDRNARTAAAALGGPWAQDPARPRSTESIGARDHCGSDCSLDAATGSVFKLFIDQDTQVSGYARARGNNASKPHAVSRRPRQRHKISAAPADGSLPMDSEQGFGAYSAPE